MTDHAVGTAKFLATGVAKFLATGVAKFLATVFSCQAVG
jgi:hypothetical protein